MRYLAMLVLLAAPLFASADIHHTFVWKPMPGKGNQTIQNGLAAKPLHEKLGARISIRADYMGHMYYTTSFATWADFAKFQVDAAQDKEWMDLWAKINAGAAAELIGVYLTEDVSAPPAP